jgi:type I restriction enzyme S subunit
MKQGWEAKKLGDLCLIELGKTPYRGDKSFWDEEKETGNIWLSIADLLNTDGDIVFDSKEYITDKAAKISKIVKKGTLLLSFKLTLGRLAFAGKDLFTNEAIAALTIKNEKEIDKYFLYQFLSLFDWNAAAEGDVKIKGKTLNKAKLKEIEVSYPKSLPEQQRIVAILDEAFTAIAKAKANAEQNLKNAKELFDNYLQSVFENPKENWEEKKWGDLCHFVRGPFGGSLKKSIFKEEGYVVYEQKHAIHDHFNQLRYFIDEEKFNEMIRFELKSGDIIMSCSGVTLGRVAVVPENIKRGIINQALLKLTPKKNISVDFLKHWLRSKIFQDIIFKYSGGAAIPNVPAAKILKEILIPLPSLIEQKKIVSDIELMSAQTKKLEAIYQQHLNDLDELKKSILQKAFQGELTTTTSH